MSKLAVNLVAAGYCVVILAGCGLHDESSRTPQATVTPVPTLHGITPHPPEPSEHAGTTDISATSEGDTKLYDIAYDNAPVSGIVREFSKLPDASVVFVPDELNGTATVHLTGVAWKPALRSILGMHNLRLVERIPGTGVYSVITQVPGEPDPLLTDVLLFDTRDEAIEVAQAIQTVWGEHASVYAAAIPSRKAVIISAHESGLEEIKYVLRSVAKGRKDE